MKKSSTLLSILLVSSTFLFAQDKTKSLDFDGLDDYVAIPHSSLLNLGRSEFTIEAWIKADTNNNGTEAPIVLSKKGSSSPSMDGFLFGLSSSGKIALQIEGQSFTPGFGWGGGGVPSIDLRDSQCHHIAWTRETNGVEDTVNGYQDAAYVRKTRLAAGTLDISNNEDVWIGWSDFNTNPKIYQFSGMIKEIRIWNYAKTEAQIFDDKNKHIVGNEAGLIAYWRLNENFGDTAYDCSGNDNHGKLMGPTWTTFCTVFTDTLPSTCVPDTGSGPVDTTGIAELKSDLNIKVFPNPSKGKLIVDLNKVRKEVRINLSNIQGQVIDTWSFKQIDKVELELPEEKGLYFLQVSTINTYGVARVVRE